MVYVFMSAVISTVVSESSLPKPSMTVMPSALRFSRMPLLCLCAHFIRREFNAGKSTRTSSTCTPRTLLPRASVTASATAINALLGTTSVRTAEPPRPWRSTKVTSAPSWRATSAASYPPGPPPMITSEVTCLFFPMAIDLSYRLEMLMLRGSLEHIDHHVECGAWVHERESAHSFTLPRRRCDEC